jgi:transposase
MPSYPSSLNDDEWEVLRKLIPKPPLSLRGRPVSYTKRSIIDGILYIIRSGAGWRMMPNDLPHWKTCYHYFRIWAKQGVWIRIHDSLRDKARLSLGKKKPRPLRSSTARVFGQLANAEFVVMMRVKRLREEKDMPW